MQSMSYFHLNTSNKGNRIWNQDSITSLAPLEVRYSGKGKGILGIMCLGEQPSPSMLIHAIEGTLMAMVVVDDMAAIAGCARNDQTDRGNNPEYSEQTILREMGNDDIDVMATFPRSLNETHLQTPFIVQTPEGVPYLNPGITTPLDPRYSHTIGLALLRGIDIKRRRLQLLTPISGSIIDDLNKSEGQVVLVSGKLDIPGWAFTEETYKMASMNRHPKLLQTSDMPGQYTEGSENEGEENIQIHSPEKPAIGFDYIPWVDKLQGNESRGMGARVWKVRRDLGRTSQVD